MLSTKAEPLDINKYEVRCKLLKKKRSKYYQIINIESGMKSTAKISRYELKRLNRDDMLDFSQQVEVLSQLNHPSLPKFIGYSPIDFKGKLKSVIIINDKSIYPAIEYFPVFEKRRARFQKYSHFIIRNEENNMRKNLQKYDTKILIIIYGIASGMSYLHSHNIIHRDLKLSNIFLDDQYYPRIMGFDISKKIYQLEDGSILNNDMNLKGNVRYLAPEILENLEYSKAGDVYSFAMVLYEMFMGEKPFEYYNRKNKIDIIKHVTKNFGRPLLNDSILPCFQNLIERCWFHDPKDRPTFDQIVRELKENPEFITDDINKEEFQKYISLIDGFPTTLRHIIHYDRIDKDIKSLAHRIDKIDPTMRGSDEQGPFLDINDYYCTWKYIYNKKTDAPFSFRENSQEITNLFRYEIKNLCREINIISRINHPAILKFIGYSPVNFDNKAKPIIVNEFFPFDSLKFYEPLNESGYFTKKIDNTRKIIILYGVASGMSYLHSHNIIHRDLKLSNIVLDVYSHPKITGFNISKEIKEELNEKNETIKGTPAYIAPEVYLHEGYSKASDVYSFSLIMYELLTEEIPYKDLKDPNEIREEVAIKKHRPSFNKPIPKVYRNLIEKCWSPNSKDRPTFDEILIEFQENDEFLIYSIDVDELFEYMKYIQDFPITFESSSVISQFENILQNKIHTFPEIKTSLHLKDMYTTEMNNLSFNNYICVNIYDTEKIYKGNFYEIKKYVSQNTEYAVKKTIRTERDFFKHEIINFSRKLSIIFLLNHPAILKYIGYDYGKFKDIYIVTEYASYGSLKDILEMKQMPNELNTHFERRYSQRPELVISETNKLIIIYGIASGMSYLHSHNIIHRDLKPSNIYLNEILYPKISGFNISKEIKEELNEKNETIKGTPAYIAPEVYLHEGYSKASDVYSFSLIMYELLTEEIPYKDLKDPNEIREEVAIKKHRPSFNKPIPKVYRNLIEKCWSPNPKDRPTFDEILIEFQENDEFLIYSIDVDELFEYMKYIQDFPITFDSSSKIQDIENLARNKLSNFESFDTSINVFDNYETETNNLVLNNNFIDINNYEKQKLIFHDDNSLYKIHVIKNKISNELYFAKTMKYRDDYVKNQGDMIDFISELKNTFMINHPLFLKFIGYSPFDFKNRKRPIIITEYASNDSLGKLLDIEKKSKSISLLDDTKKLIIIFGIAAALSYLHSQNIFHCHLRPSCIYLDDYLFPKITGLELSKDCIKNPIISESQFSNLYHSGYSYSDIYTAPEINTCFAYSSAADVYSFAMITYHLICDDPPFSEDEFYELEEVIFEKGYRPIFKKDIPECYKSLIKKCWVRDPKKRPTFDEIVFHIKTNSDFITDKVNEQDFRNYVKFIEEASNKIDSNCNISQIDDFIKTQNQTFRKIKIDYSNFRNNSNLLFSVNMGTTDLTHYEKRKRIGEGSFGNAYKITEKGTGKVFVAKISRYEIDQWDSDDLITNLIREIEIMSSLNHPSILHFIGYNPKNFKGKQKPVILMEHAPFGSLCDILEREREECGVYDWNDTKKLICIYGIAAGMLYLHNKDIIHRDLKPDNILLDEYLYPKIADFGLSKKLQNESMYEKEIKTHKNRSGLKGTFAYFAPEILKKCEYKKEGDVYAFAMIVYEIMTNEPIFPGLNRFQIMNKVLKGNRPKFTHPIPYCYRKLIEKCWSDRFRPSFEQIVKILENDPSFLTQKINSEEYLNYIIYIKESQQANFMDLTNENHSNNSKHNFKKVEFDMSNKKKEDNRYELYECFVDLTIYLINETIIKNDLFKIYKIQDLFTDNIYAAQASLMNIKILSDEEISILAKEFKKIKQINHPSILKFIGFSPINFKREQKPVVIMEYASNGTLEEIMELEKKNNSFKGFDWTKKLIIIFGIASGMSYLHSINIIHRCLKPSNIYLDDILFPKIGDFGITTKFFNEDIMTHQTVSGKNRDPIYSAPETLKYNEHSKASDVYAFSLIVYEIMTKEKPFKEIGGSSQIISEIVINKNRPKINETVPFAYKKLIEKCWSQNPKERPTFDDIVYDLKTNKDYITNDIDEEDYKKYVNFIETQIIEHKMKEETIKCEKEFIENDQKEDDISIKESKEIPKIISDTDENMQSINEFISTRNAKELMIYMNKNCDNEMMSYVFDKCFEESMKFYISLCQEGILLNSAVAHHKYAISLIMDSNKIEPPDEINAEYQKSKYHHEKAIEGGFYLSYFSLARLYFEIYKDNDAAYMFAKKGSDKNDSYSKCLLGYFIAHGIGTKKHFMEGVSLILESTAENLIDQFATDIGIYYSKIKNIEGKAIDREREMFKWFEKAFMMKQTRATINNYGTCFLQGIGVEKNKEKAKVIFQIGVSQNDLNSIYKMGIILMDTDPTNSLKFFKQSADGGCIQAQKIYARIISKTNINESLKYYNYASDQGDVESQEILAKMHQKDFSDLSLQKRRNTESFEFSAKKYSNENILENENTYMHMLIKSGNYKIPMKHALNLYNSKQFTQAYNYFIEISKFNHPIAKYFIGIMKFKGQGCQKDKEEAFEIMKFLSKQGVGKATDFLNNHFNK